MAKTWQDLTPTHQCPNGHRTLYAKFDGVWQCFYDDWRSAKHQGCKFFESFEYKPDDELIPLK